MHQKFKCKWLELAYMLSVNMQFTLVELTCMVIGTMGELNLSSSDRDAFYGGGMLC